jgi:drug/metabolite transporter (DMT)-like permease
MLWILLAIIAHAGNGLVFIVDKGLLGTEGGAGDPKRLAFYSGILSALAIILVLFGYAPPNGFVIFWSLVSGVSFVVALWLFFTALDSDEASRVVPITGSAVPLFTLLFAVLFLGEEFTTRQFSGVLLLIVGGAVLSMRLGQVRGLSRRATLTAIGAGAAFAAYFAVVKYIYDSFQPFWSAFAYSRFGVGIAALLIFGPVLWRSKSQKRQRKPKASRRKTMMYIIGAFLGSKVLGTSMFILQNYAISLGSVTVVNALQGTQYLFVLILAALMSRVLPKLFKEELHQVAVMQKVTGIMFISLGLILVI